MHGFPKLFNQTVLYVGFHYFKSLYVQFRFMLIFKIISGENWLFSYGVLFLGVRSVLLAHMKKRLLTKVEALWSILSVLCAGQWAST